jgi:hypothetical protein
LLKDIRDKIKEKTHNENFIKKEILDLAKNKKKNINMGII